MFFSRTTSRKIFEQNPDQKISDHKTKQKPLSSKFQRKASRTSKKHGNNCQEYGEKKDPSIAVKKQVINNAKTTLNSQQFLTLNFTKNCQQKNGPGRRIANFPRARSHFGGKHLRSLWQLEAAVINLSVLP
jgi:hypothetical protein